MVQVNSTDLKQVLLTSLTDVKEKERYVGNNKIGRAYVNAKREVLENLLMFIHKSEKQGDMDMAKLTLEFKKGNVKLDDILTNFPRGGKIEPKILEVAKEIPPGDGKVVEVGTMSWGHFSGAVYRMVEKGVLKETYPGEWGPIKRPDRFVLAHYTQEQAKAFRRPKKKVREAVKS